jgi:hypothetical protein
VLNARLKLIERIPSRGLETNVIGHSIDLVVAQHGLTGYRHGGQSVINVSNKLQGSKSVPSVIGEAYQQLQFQSRLYIYLITKLNL